MMPGLSPAWGDDGGLCGFDGGLVFQSGWDGSLGISVRSEYQYALDGRETCLLMGRSTVLMDWVGFIVG